MKDLSTGNPPSHRPSDFPDEISYDEWKHEESKAISEIMVSMISANPKLAKSEPTEVLSSLLSDSAEKPDLRRTISDNPNRYSVVEVEQLNILANGRSTRPDMTRRISLNDDHDDHAKNQYTFIPEDPRAYYRRLLELCLKAQKYEQVRPDDEDSVLSTATLQLLNECSVRWRIHPAARIALLLDVVRQLYGNEELGIGDIHEAFAMADNWNYSSWPNADVTSLLSKLNGQKFLFSRVLVTMHETLLRDLYNVLQRVFDPKPLNPKPILLILDQYIYSNPLFSESETDLASIIADLELGVRVVLSIFSADIRIAQLKCMPNDENSSWTNRNWISDMFTTLLTHSSIILRDFINDSRILFSGIHLYPMLLTK
jgi:hypothetical protein